MSSRAARGQNLKKARKIADKIPTMKLGELISISSYYDHQDGIPAVLGDCLLVTENLIYRNIRQTAKKLGAEFVTASLEYQMTPFLQLGQILQTRKIPYTPTADILKNIEVLKPNLFLVEQIPSLPASYHFHESCHVIADHLLHPSLEQGQSEFILNSLLCESFANSAELFATAFNATALGSDFLRYNSYIKGSAEFKRNANLLIEQIGFKDLFKLTLYSYLHANFLFETLSFRDFRKMVLSIFESDPIPFSLARQCYDHFQEGFKLNPHFRSVTNSFFLGLSGVQQNFLKALDFDFHSKIRKSVKTSNAIDQMCEIVEMGRQSPMIRDLLLAHGPEFILTKNKAG